jgi:hypothetical protein
MKSMSKAGLMVGLAVALAGSTSVAQNRESSLRTTSGIDLLVVDPSGAAIPKAKVSIKDGRNGEIADGLTDRSGKFIISQFPSGAYQLTISLHGFQPYAKTLDVLEHTVADLTVTLPIDPATVLHRGNSAFNLVVNDGSGAVIPKARVSLTQIATRVEFEGRTDESGVFHGADLSSGQYTVRIERLGFLTVEVPTHLDPNETREMAITLRVSPTPPDFPPEFPGPEPKISRLDSEQLPYPTVLRPMNPPQSKPQGNRIKRFFSTLGRKLAR